MDKLNENTTLYKGDMVEVLRTLDENSVDTCITDPPYHLTSIVKRFGKEGSAPAKYGTDGVFARASAGFMGKEWDGGDIAFRSETWAEVYRVLKPGAYLLAFGGTRTYHRMACAVEDAGFVVMDCAVWAHGCLSEDTEILTSRGWIQVPDDHKWLDGHDVLCYDIDKDTFEFHRPTRLFIYENEHTAYRIQSDYTDQIVSRNHRCIIERGGRKVFAYAETLQREESVPFLESLRDLPESIPNHNTRASIKKQDLLKRVRDKEFCEENNWQNNFNERQKDDTGKMRDLRKRILQTRCLDKKKTRIISLLFQKLFIKSKGRSHERHSASFETSVDRKKFGWFCGENERSKQSSMERGRYPEESSRKLSGRKIHKMSEGISGNGTKGRVCNGAPIGSGAISWQTVVKDGNGTPYQSQSVGQQNRESYVVQEQSGAQTVRSTRAKVTPIDYRGKIWCVEVPTGAFVARRNGKIFITGNSGFPKAYNISKGMDKRAGAVREKDDVPVTPEATLWQNHRTALKPAVELIVIAMKPVDKSYVDNALKWGVAGFNIEGARIKTDEIIPINKLESWSGFGQIVEPDYEQEENTKGRYPANLLIDDSQEVWDLFPDSNIGNGGKPYSYAGREYHNRDTSMFNGDKPQAPSNYNDNGSAARFFYCAKASKSEKEFGLSNPAKHPTVKPISLMEHLVTLTATPTGGIVLDPFMGSGTTGIACVLQGRRFIGIEREDDYYRDATERITHYINQPKQERLL